MNPIPADERQFLELVHENQKKILRICRVYAWNSADQDDLYQEILFQVWRSLPSMKGQFSNTWLYRVAINTAISFVRKRTSGADRLVHFEFSELSRAIESRQETEEPAHDRIASLYTSIYKLNPLEKALVTLYLEDFTYEQIAEATGITASNVGVMLHRARKKLFSLIKEEEASK